MWKETDLESRLDPDLHTQVKRIWDVSSANHVGSSAYAAYVTNDSKKGLAKTQRQNIDVESQNLLRVQHTLISLLLRERERPFRSVFFSLKQAYWLGELGDGSRNFVKP
jgi:hypothetical protein